MELLPIEWKVRGYREMKTDMKLAQYARVHENVSPGAGDSKPVFLLPYMYGHRI